MKTRKRMVRLMVLILSITVTTGHAELTDGLVAYYPLNGDASDASGNAHDAIAFGPVSAVDRDGNADGAYCFDGLDDYIEIGSLARFPTGSDSRTVSAWFMTTFDNADQWRAVLSYGGCGDGRLFSICQTGWASSPSNQLGFGGWGYDSYSGRIINDGAWHHAASTYTYPTIKIYLDGSLVAIDDSKTEIDTGASSGRIGSLHPDAIPWDGLWNGLIDDVAFWNRELSESEVQALYMEGISDQLPPNSRPIAKAGPDQSVDVGDAVMLDGTASRDPDGNVLTYEWSLSSTPAGSSASLIDSSSANPMFTVDLPGQYVIELTVGDGQMYSMADTVVITAETAVTHLLIGRDPVRVWDYFPETTNGTNGICLKDGFGNILSSHNVYGTGYEFWLGGGIPVIMRMDGTNPIAQWPGMTGDIYAHPGFDRDSVIDVSIETACSTIRIAGSVYLVPEGYGGSGTGDVIFSVVHTGQVVWTSGVVTEHHNPVGFDLALDVESLDSVQFMVTSYGGISHDWAFWRDIQLVGVAEATNSCPSILEISAPTDPVRVGTPVVAGASFSDADSGDTHSATWDWGDGTSLSTGTIHEDMTVDGSHVYTAAGVYTLALTVTDQAGDWDEEPYTFVVVYDPAAGFVTGGGWIDSPVGAYSDDLSLEGKATFGFVSKYHKNAEVPSGTTEFQFKAGDLHLHSSSYDWLVVTGSNYAKVKGSGTINGAGLFKFWIWAGDGQPDTFRIRIWEEDDQGNEMDVYDNGFDQAIGGGSIVIHTQ